MSDSEFELDGGLFEEPEDFRPSKPEAHYQKYIRVDDKCHPEIKEIKLRLVGKSPLWGHLLWNAGIYTARYIEDWSQSLVKDKTVVEFGAAAALPSLLSAINGASKVVATDYPDPDLLENIQINVDNLADRDVTDRISVKGFIWGNDTTEIKETLGSTANLIIMSDLVFNHTEHHKLLKSAKELITPLQAKPVPRTGGKCLVVWSPHRPAQKMVENDFKFFADARDLFQFDVEFVEMVHWDHPMFPEDPQETEEIRKRVYCYILHPTW
ncbi:hypothetical protein OGAPHI_004817 [Ogataea philodendri]|uniref:Elongation factor methyltransferase 7 n=1 Tax=Ogataea philodendri TaxID=1378263 RepID=A0A9P8P1J0_9ASCO|nr:uncharacterized protein OGAPHI_004817 [Ogataea philodendri]KAH3664103.1 hypothetical protein OGAPHI_004817 [Ogataea philodendri]